METPLKYHSSSTWPQQHAVRSSSPRSIFLNKIPKLKRKMRLNQQIQCVYC